jgi:hypothetical protein
LAGGNPYKKNRAGGVAQVIDHLPSKHEALMSRPSTAKKIIIIN